LTADRLREANVIDRTTANTWRTALAINEVATHRDRKNGFWVMFDDFASPDARADAIEERSVEAVEIERAIAAANPLQSDFADHLATLEAVLDCLRIGGRPGQAMLNRDETSLALKDFLTTYGSDRVVATRFGITFGNEYGTNHVVQRVAPDRWAILESYREWP